MLQKEVLGKSVEIVLHVGANACKGIPCRPGPMRAKQIRDFGVARAVNLTQVDLKSFAEHWREWASGVVRRTIEQRFRCSVERCAGDFFLRVNAHVVSVLLVRETVGEASLTGNDDGQK